MNFYLDFEATQPGNEIISVGVICENGDTFHSYVKPYYSGLTPFITEMTGITYDMIDSAPDINKVFYDLYYWIEARDSVKKDWNFYVYGNSDTLFIHNSADYFRYTEALTLAGIMLLKIRDYSIDTKKYFRGGVSLIKAFNYVVDAERIQNHDALEDARMLQKVVEYIDDKKPLTQNPFLEEIMISNSNITIPRGKFYAKDTKTNSELEFETMDDAVDWVIETLVRPSAETIVHRNRIITNIMKAVRKKGKYQNYKWRRDKNA